MSDKTFFDQMERSINFTDSARVLAKFESWNLTNSAGVCWMAASKTPFSALFSASSDKLFSKEPLNGLELNTITSAAWSIDPNISSPANVDAAISFKKDKAEYARRIHNEVNRSRMNMPKDFVFPKMEDAKEEEKEEEVEDMEDWWEDDEEEDYYDDEEEEIQ